MTTDIKAAEALCDTVDATCAEHLSQYGWAEFADALSTVVRKLINENEALKQQHAQAVSAAYREAYEITPNHAVTATEKYFAVLSAWKSSQAKQRLEEG